MWSTSSQSYRVSARLAVHQHTKNKHKTFFCRACAAGRSSGGLATSCQELPAGLLGVVGRHRMDRMEVLLRQRRELEERYYKVRALEASLHTTLMFACKMDKTWAPDACRPRRCPQLSTLKLTQLHTNAFDAVLRTHIFVGASHF